MDKKKIICISVLAVVAIIIVILMINIVASNKTNEKEFIKSQTLELSQVFEIDDIENSKYETVKNKELEVNTQYLTNDNKYELNANVKFNEEIGRTIYIREEYEKVNIYQEEHLVNKYEDKNIKIEEIMTEFERKCQNYMNADDEAMVTEQLYGESTVKGEIPVAESIYSENRLYSKTYTVEDEIEKIEKKYDINFYKKDEKIVCEFVYYINND